METGKDQLHLAVMASEGVCGVKGGRERGFPFLQAPLLLLVPC